MGKSGRGRARAGLAVALVTATLGGTFLTFGSVAGATTTVTLFVATDGTGTCSEASPCPSLQTAVGDAETYRGDVVTIHMAAGTYAVTTVNAGTLASLTIEGADVSTTAVRGNEFDSDITITGGRVTVESLTVEYSTATTGAGIDNAGTLTATHDLFRGDLVATFTPTTDHTRGKGGGIYNKGTLTATFDAFSNDSATTGGDIYNAASGMVIATDDTFTGNDGTATLGGGVYNVGTVIAGADTFTDDYATTGGAVFNTGIATAADDTFSGNSAMYAGAGVFNDGTFTAVGDTFSSDSGGDGATGGGVLNVDGGVMSVTASIIDKSPCRGYMATDTVAYNVVTATCRLFGTPVTASAIDLSSSLESTPSYPTTPATRAIGPTSVAIDEVPPTSCELTTDERGALRPGDTTATGLQDNCDAGAYELRHHISPLIQTTASTSGSTTSGTSGSFPLAVSNPTSTTGPVRFTLTSASVTGVTVSSTGRIAVSTSTAPGSYTLSGTATDRLQDTGTWTFGLTVSRPPVASTAPEGLSAVATTSSVTLSWEAPASDGTSPLIGYEVFRSTVSGEGGIEISTVVPATTAYTDSAVTQGTAYYYTVFAENAVGASGPSNEAAATVPRAPATTSLSSGAAMSSTPTGKGWWITSPTGAVEAYGTARLYGSLSGEHLNAPVVGMASPSTGKGYWLVAADGGVFAFGSAVFHGSMGGQHLNEPVVGMAEDPTTGGYWLVAADGGVFAFTTPFYGSMGGQPLDSPVVGIAPATTGLGYDEVATDGGIFAFGAATFHGSEGAAHLNKPVVGMAIDPGSGGYWLVASDGGVFSFTAPFYGSEATAPPASSVLGIVVTPAGDGYTIVDQAGAGATYGT